MRRSIILLILLLSFSFYMNLTAQEIPLVYNLENRGADYPKPYLPTFNELPTIEPLPDPFEWSDGSGRIENFSDWRFRRNEISVELQHYQLGDKPAPPEPDSISATYSSNTLTVTVHANGKTLNITADITLPSSGSGPFPAIIGLSGPTGSLPFEIFSNRNVATIQYNFSNVAPWTQDGRGMGGFYRLYPDSKVGYFTAWAWGISRLIDGLQMLPETNIDTEHLGITGCSFAGKMALYSGALDERIALTISQEPGGGGDAAWRVTETLSGSRETLRNAQGYGWYYSDVSIFNSAVTKLPFDQHETMALIAPRALLVLGNPTQEWLADESGYVACMAAKEVWNALGVPDRFGFSKVGDHPHCSLPESQYPEVGAFVERFLLGDTTVNTDVAIAPEYNSNLSYWIPWETPQLANDTTYYTSLVYPGDNENSVDTSIIFKWTNIENAEEYLVQISTDPVFENIDIEETITSDSTLSVNNLSKNTRYYWRVRVKSSAGFGPWSSTLSFVTTVSLPTEPQIISANCYKTGYVTLTWLPVEAASKYVYNLSLDESFSNVFKSGSTTDTSYEASWFQEGNRYYWKVRANNLAGNSPWSQLESFSIIYPPTNLSAEQNNSNMLTLTWSDKSSIETGYVVERKLEADADFSVLTTIAENSTEYVDNSINPDETYIYRVKASTDSTESEYTNETSIITGVESDSEVPVEYSLSQNYPNPFNPTTTIKFGLPQAGLTKIIVYDFLGREVKSLLNNELEAGYHNVNVDAKEFSSGVYFYRITSGNFTATKKMILLK